MSQGVCEEQLFLSIFKKESSGLRSFLYFKSKDIQRSEDWVQDAFAKLWQNCTKVPLAKSKSYLYTVANNLFLSQVAHTKVVLRYEKQSYASEVDKTTPAYLLEQQEFKTKLENAIAALPEDQRLVFLMNRIEKKKYREIAEILGVSQKTIEKRMHKALTVLRKIHLKV